MTAIQTETLANLYLDDETAWLERMAEVVQFRNVDALDFENLSEYLSDMAKRDRREVESRLAVLTAHLLKWTHQPDRRTGSWRSTIEVQRHELELLLQSRTLRNHAEDKLESSYVAAVRQAASDTGLSIGQFPADCPFTIDNLITLDELESKD